MRSESTSALGQPSETKEILGGARRVWNSVIPPRLPRAGARGQGLAGLVAGARPGEPAGPHRGRLQCSEEATMVKNLQCRCGAVELEAAGEPTAQFFCHCDDCQAVHGAAYAPSWSIPGFGADRSRRSQILDVETKPSLLLSGLRNAPVHRRARPWLARRQRLSACRRRLPSALPYALSVCRSPPVFDELPHFKFRPARFGGADETVDW